MKPFPPHGRLSLFWLWQPAFVRIVGCLLKKTGQRLLAYGLMGSLVIIRLLYLISLPLPLFRLYILAAAFVGIIFCLWQTVAGKRRGHSRAVIWIFRIGCLYLAVVLALEIFGASNLSEFLLIVCDQNTLCIIRCLAVDLSDAWRHRMGDSRQSVSHICPSAIRHR